MGWEEEADGGNPGGACGQGSWGVGGGEATESEEGDREGMVDGLCEGGETDGRLNGLRYEWGRSAGGRRRVVDDFAEDGAKEEEVGLGGAQTVDLVEGVDGGRKDGGGAAGRGVVIAGVGGECGWQGGGKVDAIEPAMDGKGEEDVRREVLVAEIEEQPGFLAEGDDGAEGVKKVEDGGGSEVFFADLEEVNRAVVEVCGLGEKRAEVCWKRGDRGVEGGQEVVCLSWTLRRKRFPWVAAV